MTGQRKIYQKNIEQNFVSNSLINTFKSNLTINLIKPEVNKKFNFR